MYHKAYLSFPHDPKERKCAISLLNPSSLLHLLLGILFQPLRKLRIPRRLALARWLPKATEDLKIPAALLSRHTNTSNTVKTIVRAPIRRPKHTSLSQDGDHALHGQVRFIHTLLQIRLHEPRMHTRSPDFSLVVGGAC